MFGFHRITLEDREHMKKIFEEDGWFGCEYTFGNNVLWGKKYYIEVAYVNTCCVVRYDLSFDSSTGQRGPEPEWMYSYPIGAGDKKEIIDALIQDSLDNHYTLFFNSVSEEARKNLLAWYPGRFAIRENRDYEDYIYTREKLATLAGKKLHKKRTHINHFKEQGDWSYEVIDDHNVADCLALCDEWAKENADRWDSAMEEELQIARRGLKMRGELHLQGGLLRVNGQPAAFCISEQHSEELVVVHFEKALTRYAGAYQMINQQFALHLDEKIKYINREEDTGNPGLRQAKLSYYPDILLKKYNAIYSDVVYADPVSNRGDVIHIWKSVFGDSEAFIEEFLNRMQEEDTILLYCVEGKPVSMACFLPITIKGSDSETDSDARYVYAVATLPEYRNRGFIRKLLAFAEKEFHQPLVLSPAEPDLYAYYEKLGFRKLYTDETEVTMIEPAHTTEEAEDAACVSNQKLTPSEYKKLRDSLFTEPGTFQWNEKSVDFIYYYYGSEETHAVSLTSKDGEEELLMYRQEEDSLKILENTLSEEELQAVLTQPAMYKALGLTGQIKQTSQYHPGLMIWDADETTYFLTEGHGYFNFSLGD